MIESKTYKYQIELIFREDFQKIIFDLINSSQVVCMDPSRTKICARAYYLCRQPYCFEGFAYRILFLNVSYNMQSWDMIGTKKERTAQRKCVV